MAESSVNPWEQDWAVPSGANPWDMPWDAPKPSMLDTVKDRMSRAAGIATRAVGPQAAGAAMGAAMGAPLAGVGAIPGAAAGAGAATILQLVDRLAGTNYLDKTMTKLGLPQPANAPERIATDVGGALAGMGSQLGVLGQMATRAGPASNVGANIAENLIQQPARQMVAAGAGAAAAGGTREAGGTPTQQTVAGLVGGAMPFVPQMLSRPRTPEYQRLIETADQGRNIGMILPPADIKPTVYNRIGEWLGGGKGQQRDIASINNARAATNAIKADFGLGEQEQLSTGVLRGIRDRAAGAYSAIEGAGPFRTDSRFVNDLHRLGRANETLRNEAPSLSSPQISRVLDELAGYQATDLSGRTIIAATQRFRELGSQAFRNGDTGIGRFYRGASDALEDLVSRRLAQSNQTDLLNNWRDARVQIAKTYTAEAALNDATGMVEPRILASQWDRGSPMRGNMETVGRFATAFPTSTRSTQNIGHVNLMSQFDFGLGGLGYGLGAMSGHPEAAALLALRPTVRAAMMSRGGQGLLASPELNPLTRTQAGMYGVLSAPYTTTQE